MACGVRPQVRRWEKILAMIGMTENYVRHQGIHAKAARRLAGCCRTDHPGGAAVRKQFDGGYALETSSRENGCWVRAKWSRSSASSNMWRELQHGMNGDGADIGAVGGTSCGGNRSAP